VLSALTEDNLATAVAIAELPDQIRGFGPVKDASRAKAQARRTQLLADLTQLTKVSLAAE
jgi:indolepyruvate ferredoxin oxidoreductase